MSCDHTSRLFSDTLPITITDRGEGRAFLVLSGGTGPASVSGLAEEISKKGRAIVPTHPGYSWQPRPDWFHRVDALVLAYLVVLERLDLSDVVLIANPSLVSFVSFLKPEAPPVLGSEPSSCRPVPAQSEYGRRDA